MDEDVSPLREMIPVLALPAHGREAEIYATEKERAAISKMFGLESVDSLQASFHVTKGTGPLITVQGSLTADVMQTCSVTLEPVKETVAADIAMTFTLDPAVTTRDVDINVQDADPPDPVIDGHIDLGAIALEHFALNLNPYPRAEGVNFDDRLAAGAPEPADSAHQSPFSVLKKLQQTEK